MAKPTPIPWDSVALVGYRDGVPCIISSAQPDHIFDFFWTSGDEEENEIYDHDFDRESFVESIREQAKLIEWKLYPVDVAKEIFCSYKHKRSGEAPPSPLTGQLTLPIK